VFGVVALVGWRLARRRGRRPEEAVPEAGRETAPHGS
jgi:hypothetical protein